MTKMGEVDTRPRWIYILVVRKRTGTRLTSIFHSICSISVETNFTLLAIFSFCVVLAVLKNIFNIDNRNIYKTKNI